MNNMEIEVTNCNDCLFKGMGGWEGEYNQCNAKEGKKIPATKKIFGEIVSIPKWCPLLKKDIIIKMRKNDNSK